MNDIAYVLNWWGLWFLLGLISLPVATKLLNRIYDHGYASAKLLGILVISYLIWIGASLHWWRFGVTSTWVSAVLWIVINGIVLKFNFKNFGEIIRDKWQVWLKVEVIYLFLLIVWAWVRSFSPDINGLEKFMDYGFVNSILRSDYFPPNDMWYAGGSINYYYYGHYLAALVIRMSAIPTEVGYNLMLASILAGSATLVWSLSSTLISQIPGIKKNRILITLAGLSAIFFLAFRGNLHYGASELNLALSVCPVDNSSLDVCQPRWPEISKLLPDVSKPYWYPDATRYIPFTIHEFPIYSFVVADLHAHLSNLPFVLLLLTVLVSLLLAIEEMFWIKILTLGWMLGLFYVTNAWDWPIYSLVVGMSLLIKFLPKLSFRAAGSMTGVMGLALILFGWFYIPVKINHEASILQIFGQQLATPFGIILLVAFGMGIFWTVKDYRKETKLYLPLIMKLVLPGIVMFGLSIICVLPFHLAFVQIAQGVDFVHVRSEFSKLLVLWGWDWLVGLILLVIVSWTWLKNRKINYWDVWMIGLWAIGILLIIIPEIIYVKDIYIEDYHRANTMFKLVYQSWTLFSLVSTYTIFRIIATNQKSISKLTLKIVVLAILIPLIWVMGVYPVKAIMSYYPISAAKGGINSEAQKYGLNGVLWLKEKNSDEYAVLEFLRSLPGHPVILEAVGDSYTEFNRFSAYTGLPTVEGWLVHEWLWRGSYDGPGRRAAEVEQLYTAPNLTAIKPLYQADPVPAVPEEMKKYKIEYVVVGEKEREKYDKLPSKLNEENFKALGTVVFESGQSRVYKLNQ